MSDKKVTELSSDLSRMCYNTHVTLTSFRSGWSLSLLIVLACGGEDRRPGRADDASVTTDSSVVVDGSRPDATSTDGALNSDSACAVATSEAMVENRPVDIIFMVDNSTSMEPAVRNVNMGLNRFAQTIGGSGLDYRVIMLSKRGVRGGAGVGDLYPICIPSPLGGADCANSERFFHADVNIYSTQLVEQFLGTLGQTAGYTDDGMRGSEAWRPWLRADATKTIVFVTDDDSRTCDRVRSGSGSCTGTPELEDLSLETFPGGANPFRRADALGPGVLHASYDGMFTGYTFNAIYGWNSETDRTERCTFPDDSQPPSEGQTYTALVQHTGGVRAKICDQASSAAWDTFFMNVAQRVEDTARISCELDLPAPPAGMSLDPTRVNVLLRSGAESRTLGKVENAAACTTLTGGWYYDNDANPTQVLLCPTTCEDAQEALRASPEGAAVDVQFGCATQLI